MWIKWEKDYSAKTQRYFGVAVGLGVGTLLGLVLAKGWPDVNWLLDWTAVAAVATLIAGAIALWLGLNQFRHMNAARDNEARIVAAYMAPILEKAAATLHCFLNEFPASAVQLTPESEENLLGLWALERITIKEVVSYSGIAPYEASVLGENINSLIGILELKNLPRASGPTTNYNRVVFSMQTGQSGERLRKIAISLYGLSARMRHVAYHPPA
ncbi:hypothetical protein [Alcaligenes faecalis]|uniref:hypothetical protein n=1 Tax=Alcaligenes faecalis TaxID=511 RepID=UPI001EEFEA35|nr:hypothetical protein [Alcaligenes faecalis]ULH08197.1 hypothetical protein MF263_07020 [Alcaligenes faecalis]